MQTHDILTKQLNIENKSHRYFGSILKAFRAIRAVLEQIESLHKTELEASREGRVFRSVCVVIFCFRRPVCTLRTERPSAWNTRPGPPPERPGGASRTTPPEGGRKLMRGERQASYRLVPPIFRSSFSAFTAAWLSASFSGSAEAFLFVSRTLRIAFSISLEVCPAFNAWIAKLAMVIQSSWLNLSCISIRPSCSKMPCFPPAV